MHMDEVEYSDGAGTDLLLPTTLSYSTGDPCLELIEETPGTVWVRNEHSNLHHLGFWTDGFDAATASLARVGLPAPALRARAGDDTPVSFAYHGLDDFGVRVELVDAVDPRGDGVPVRARPGPGRTTMLQVRVHGPGDVRVDDVPEPDPGPDDVVVRVTACGICGSDLSYIRLGGLAGPVPSRCVSATRWPARSTGSAPRSPASGSATASSCTPATTSSVASVPGWS